MNLRKVLKPAAGILVLAFTAVLSSCIFIGMPWVEVGTVTFFNVSDYPVTVTSITCYDSSVYASDYYFTLPARTGKKTVSFRAHDSSRVYNLGFNFDYSDKKQVTFDSVNGATYFRNNPNPSNTSLKNIIADPSSTEEESATATATAQATASAQATAAPVNQ